MKLLSFKPLFQTSKGTYIIKKFLFCHTSIQFGLHLLQLLSNSLLNSFRNYFFSFFFGFLQQSLIILQKPVYQAVDMINSTLSPRTRIGSECKLVKLMKMEECTYYFLVFKLGGKEFIVLVDNLWMNLKWEFCKMEECAIN